MKFGAKSDLFQWAPTLGGECYAQAFRLYIRGCAILAWFQWAPTLGGECYMWRMEPLQEFQ
jgi:hypothetical protein